MVMARLLEQTGQCELHPITKKRGRPVAPGRLCRVPLNPFGRTRSQPVSPQVVGQARIVQGIG